MRNLSTVMTDVQKKKKNKKGFSLVELIVVLVIMAILVAALVPSLMGYIRQARQSTLKDEAASCVQAAQTIASSAYASSDLVYTSETSDSYDVDFDPSSGTSYKDAFLANGTAKECKDVSNYLDAILNLAEIEVPSDSSSSSVITSVQLTAGVVTKLVYVGTTGTVTYDRGTYEVS